MANRNKYVLLIVFLILHIFSDITEVRAGGTETLSSGEEIELIDDRVAPNNNTNILKETDLDIILEEVGYSTELINKWDINRKRELASYGGNVVENVSSELVHEYIALNGKNHIVTPENRKKIRDIQIQDLEKIGVQKESINNFNILEANYSHANGLIQDGKWGAKISLVQIDETDNDYKFMMMLDYYWDSQPTLNFNDSMALHWGHYGQPVANTAVGINAINLAGSGNWINFDHDMDLSSNYGISSTFNTSPSGDIFGPQMGFLQEAIWISKDYTGNNLALSAKYVHPWSPNFLSLSIDYGGISVSGGGLNFGDEWSWRYNFIP